MSFPTEYLITTYIADRHREAQQRLPGCGRDTSRQELKRRHNHPARLGGRPSHVA